MHVTFHDPRCLNAMQNLKQDFRDVLEKHPKKFTIKKRTLYGPKMPFFFTAKRNFSAEKLINTFQLSMFHFVTNASEQVYKNREMGGPGSHAPLLLFSNNFL